MTRREALIRDIFAACAELSDETGRPFSPDGHLVGTIGEVIAAERCDLTLMPPSTAGFDATDSEGRKVEIKTTTRSAVALSAAGTQAERLIVVQLDESGVGSVVYDGGAEAVWAAAGIAGKNGQRRIGLSTLARISDWNAGS